VIHKMWEFHITAERAIVFKDINRRMH